MLYNNFGPDSIEDDLEICTECNCDPCECTYCKDCKTTNGCSCDEQYEAYKDRRMRGEK